MKFLGIVVAVLACLATESFAQISSEYCYSVTCYPTLEEAEAVMRSRPIFGPLLRKVKTEVINPHSAEPGLRIIYEVDDQEPVQIYDLGYMVGGWGSGTLGGTFCSPAADPRISDHCADEGAMLQSMIDHHNATFPSCQAINVRVEGGYGSPFVQSRDYGAYGVLLYDTPEKKWLRFETTCSTSGTQSRQISKRNTYDCAVGFSPDVGYYPAYNPNGSPNQNVNWPYLCRPDFKRDEILANRIRQTDSCKANQNPCFPATGDKARVEVDLQFAGRPFQRYYHSLQQFHASKFLPSGWTHSYSDYVGTGSTPYLVSGSGYFENFKSDGANRYRGKHSPDLILVREVDGSFTLSDASGEKKKFSSVGRLISVVNSSNRSADVVLEYDGDQLDVIRDANGRTLRFGYSDKFLSSVTTDDGYVVSYSYDAVGNLAEVDYGSGAIRKYHYAESGLSLPLFAQKMTGIESESGVRYASFGYTSAGLVESSRLHVGGASFVSDVELDYLSSTSVDVLTENGAVRQYVVDNGLFRSILSTEIAGRLTQSTYNADRRIASRTDPRGLVTQYVYDDVARTRTTTQVFSGQPLKATHDAYDTSGSLISRELRVPGLSGLQAVARRSYVYDGEGAMVFDCEVDLAVSAAAAYDCGASSSAPGGVRQTSRQYCDSTDVASSVCPYVGLLKQIDGPRTDIADVTTYTYRAADDPTCASAGACTYRKGDLWKVTNALGQVVETVSYDKNGRITRSKDANGTLTDFTYHPRGWLATRAVRANASGFPSTDDATTTLAYDAVGNVTRVTQPDGSYLNYGYDAAHRLLTVTDNLGNTLDYCPGGVGTANCLDGAGNRIVEETRNGASVVKRTLRRTYDQLGQLTSQINAQNQATQTWPTLGGYDGNGNPTQVVDGLGVETRQSYDPLNRLTQTIQDYLGPDLATRDTTTGYGYDARDNLVSVTDPDGLTTTYTYDGLNDQTGLSSPDTGSTTYTYDAAGNRRTQTDARGIVSTYTYDALNRLTGVSYPTSTLNTSYAYDQPDGTTGCSGSYPAGRLTRITEETGTTTYCYDRRGNVTRKRQLMSATLSLYTVDYTWTKADRLATLTYPSGGIATYTRNAIGQINGITWKASAVATPQTLVSSATYYPFGPLNVLTYGNGRTLTKTYDQDYAIDAIQSSHVDGLKMDLTVDVMGNIVDGTDVIGGSPQVTYSYDRLYRLTGSSAGASPIEAFTYGPTGDRLSKTVGAGSPQAYTYASGSHRLANVGGVSRSHDANGNLTSAPFASPMGYDDRNRLARLTVGTEKISYHYNGRGERVHKLRDLTREEVLYDESGKRLHSFVQSTSGFGANAFREYVYLDDVPVATVDAAGIAYLETDHLGTPRVAADPTTNAWRWRWNFFGTAFGEHAPTLPASGALTLDLRYPGQVSDAETGLHYNYFRDYESATGRYIESDPIGLGGGISTYAYVSGRPLSFYDPNGLGVRRWIECGAGCKIVIESDPHKGTHAHWECGRGSDTGCIFPDGRPCDGSGPPNNRIKKCLKENGFFPPEPASNFELECGEGCKKVMKVVRDAVTGALIIIFVVACAVTGAPA